MPHLHLPHLPDRWTLGRMQNPVRGFLHGTAAVLSVAGSVWLLTHSSGGLTRRASLALFGLALVALYTISTIYHTIPWRSVWKERMQRVDHSTIFVFIAATYTPFAVVVFDGWLTWFTLSMVWSIAVVGIAQLAFFPRPSKAASVALNTTLGWLALLLVYPMAQRLPWTAIALMFLGGGLYTVGMVLLVTGRPRLWPRVFSYHEAFHVLVIAGSVAHFAVQFRYVARFTAA